MRHFWDDLRTGKRNIPGVASKYVCDFNVGDEVQITGPAGKHFVLPVDFLERDFIFLATGTGIAPYRGMLKEMFEADFKGNAWLFFGAAYQDTVLYGDVFKALTANENFHYLK